ncbi:hypothetical protein, partial [Herbaspirillum lusitanum]|uniref:hypothetical protein n=1 Tax=Herbaspirillum lusitanum TaxID=213312 RepID=UPI0012F49041
MISESAPVVTGRRRDRDRRQRQILQAVAGQRTGVVLDDLGQLTRGGRIDLGGIVGGEVIVRRAVAFGLIVHRIGIEDLRLVIVAQRDLADQIEQAAGVLRSVSENDLRVLVHRAHGAAG